jgi:GT2 family glycosyltransferase
MFEEVGGFDEYEAWEDFALWLKCVRAGAKIGRAPRAIYHIGPIKPGDRNQQTIGNKTLLDKIVKECG